MGSSSTTSEQTNEPNNLTTAAIIVLRDVSTAYDHAWNPTRGSGKPLDLKSVHRVPAALAGTQPPINPSTMGSLPSIWRPFRVGVCGTLPLARVGCQRRWVHGRLGHGQPPPVTNPPPQHRTTMLDALAATDCPRPTPRRTTSTASGGPAGRGRQGRPTHSSPGARRTPGRQRASPASSGPLGSRCQRRCMQASPEPV